MGYARQLKCNDIAYTNEELFALYKSTGNMEYKQELAVRYIPVVRSIAIQMRNVYLGFEQVEDIVNEGVIVLLGAIDKYDPTKNAKFETYISKRMRGMVIDIARKQDWVPRGLRKGYNDITDAGTRFYQEHGREPSESEISEIVGIEEGKYRDIMRKSSMLHVLSLDMALEENSEHGGGMQVASERRMERPEECLVETELKEKLVEAIKGLNEKEQLIISLYYIEEVNMREIAQILHVSEPRVSQIHSKAIKKLQESLANYDVF